MRPIVRPCIIALLAAALPATAHARTKQDEQVWVNLTATGAIKGDLLYFVEVQPRVVDGVSRLDQVILRGAIGWKLGPALTIYQGYAHIVLSVDAGKDRNEERSFQQVNWLMGYPLGGELSSRTRLEQRWRSDAGGTGWRLREMLRYELPLHRDVRGLNALVHAELFAAFNDTDWGARAGFDQLRSFAGFEVELKGKSTLEIGYLNQRINQAAGQMRMNHVALLTLFLRH